MEWSAETRTPRAVIHPERALGAAGHGAHARQLLRRRRLGVHFEPEQNLADILSEPDRRRRVPPGSSHGPSISRRRSELGRRSHHRCAHPGDDPPQEHRAPVRRRHPSDRAASRATCDPQGGTAPPGHVPAANKSWPPEEQASRTRFTGEKETEPFQQLQAIGLAYQADGAMRKLGIAVRDTLPDQSELSITLTPRTGGTSKGGKTRSKGGST